MKRRDFFRSGTIAGLGAGLISPFSSRSKLWELDRQVKNIIFLVTDGMSSGTFQMADLLRRRMDGRNSNWLQLYHDKKITRGIMDMSSLNSAVPDSAAASSSWGGGYRVNNGSLNIGPNGEVYKPILKKFKDSGKAVGCVTTVQITHATPAGFLVSHPTRQEQAVIAEKYAEENYDVLMGGGLEFFDSESREDGKDLFAKFSDKGYSVALNRDEMLRSSIEKPIIGVFHRGGLPYTLDQMNDRALHEEVPTLAEMTQKAIDIMKSNPNGFVIQVEAGKVDWAAHGNDLGAILYDQLAFDDAVKTAMDFAESDGNTLVIITTDHGNANPGLMGGRNADKNFDRVQSFKHSANYTLSKIESGMSPAAAIEWIEQAKGIAIKKEEAKELLSFFDRVGEGAGPSTIPAPRLAKTLYPYTNVGWAGTSHTSDFVEISMYGPGSEKLPPIIMNTELHFYMLEAAGL
ncbi:MAG: alkaline phosphatase [Saprospirales bacterium]|nr:MAG: alkaline phosphatase [Saprospirales bacterium]